MTIYNYLEFLIIILFFIEVQGNNSEKRRKAFFYVEAFLVLFVLGFRNYNVGGDTPAYIDFFNGKVGITFADVPIGYELFNKICNVVCLGDWRLFMILVSYVAIIPFFYCVKKYSTVVSFSFLNFLLCWQLLWLLETPFKQTTAITFFFIAYLLWINNKKKLFRYLVASLFIIWSLLTHSSMYFVIPLAIIVHFLRFDKRTAAICIVLSIVLSASVRVVLPNLYATFTELTQAYDIFDNLNQYNGKLDYDFEELNLNAYAPNAIFVLALLFLFTKEDMNKIPAKFLIVAAILNNLGISFPLISRVVMFFSLIGSSITPSGFFYDVKTLKRPIPIIVLVLLIFAFFYLHLKTCMNFKLTRDTDILPYTFWFE